MKTVSFDELPSLAGQEIGVSNWVQIDQDRVNKFADATGDHQWIHVDVERARRESPFGGPVAHGYLILSLVAAMVTDLGVVPPDAASALNYGLDKVRFIAPVKAGARVRMRASLAAAEPQKGVAEVVLGRGKLWSEPNRCEVMRQRLIAVPFSA